MSFRYRARSTGWDCSILRCATVWGAAFVAQIKEIVLPGEFKNYQRGPRLVSFVNLFYHQLVEQGS